MSSSDRITQSKGEPKELSLPTRTRQKRKAPSKKTKQEMDNSLQVLQRDWTNYNGRQLLTYYLYQLNHQACFFPVYYRSHNGRKTMLQGIICSRHRGRLTPIYTTTSRLPQAVMNFHKHCVLISPSRHTTGTIPRTISKFEVTFVSVICSSICRRQIQHQH